MTAIKYRTADVVLRLAVAHVLQLHGATCEEFPIARLCRPIAAPYLCMLTPKAAAEHHVHGGEVVEV